MQLSPDKEVRAAPRLDSRLLTSLEQVDDERQSIAETCRRLGRVASELNVTRPSYSHVRRLVIELRLDRRERREALAVVGRALRAHSQPDTVGLLDAIDVLLEPRRR